MSFYRIVVFIVIVFITMMADPAHSQGDTYASALADAFKALWILILCFCIGWTLSYTLLGTWLEMKIANRRRGQPGVPRHRYGPILTLHILYSLVFVNPYVPLFLVFFFPGYSLPVYLLPLFAWLVLIPVCLDSLLLRFIPQWPFLKWLRWTPPFKTALWGSFTAVIVSLAFSAGCLVIGAHLLI